MKTGGAIVAALILAGVSASEGVAQQSPRYAGIRDEVVSNDLRQRFERIQLRGVSPADETELEDLESECRKRIAVSVLFVNLLSEVSLLQAKIGPDSQEKLVASHRYAQQASLESGGSLDQERDAKKEAEKRRKQLDASVARLHVDVRHAALPVEVIKLRGVASDNVLIDSKYFQGKEAYAVLPGEYTLQLSDGTRSLDLEVDVRAAERKSIVADFESTRGADPTPVVDVAPPGPSTDAAWEQPTMLFGGAVVAVAGIGTLVASILISRREADKQCSDAWVCTPAGRSAISDYHWRMGVGIGAIVVGAAAFTLGLVRGAGAETERPSALLQPTVGLRLGGGELGFASTF